LTAIDAHAHVFQLGLPLVQTRRHAPDYDATLDAYVAHLRRSRISHSVLVQPSFLGYDNTFLLDMLKRYPFRLRGIATVNPHVTENELEQMVQAGVVGIRLNLIGLPMPDFAGSRWPALFERINALGWHVELHREAADLPFIIKLLLQQKCRLVVDHFGRPNPHKGIADPGFKYLLSVADTGRVWVKLSAAYRCVSSGNGHSFGGQASRLLLDAYSPLRLVWGSDWPHTQHENTVTYGSERATLDAWVPDPDQRKTILCRSTQELFHFDH
jgi:predicted TIM-barrel fold metal-dependent hydrolase